MCLFQPKNFVPQHNKEVPFLAISGRMLELLKHYSVKGQGAVNKTPANMMGFKICKLSLCGICINLTWVHFVNCGWKMTFKNCLTNYYNKNTNGRTVYFIKILNALCHWLKSLRQTAVKSHFICPSELLILLPV